MIFFFLLFQVNPSSTDLETQQIQSKLGDYSHFKHLLDEPKRLIGVDGVPASPVPSSTRGQPPGSANEFKKPSHGSGRPPSSQPHSHQVQRGGFTKPADGKPPYEGRGGYPGQPVKSISGHRSNGIVPPKGPPNSGIPNRVSNAGRTLPRIHLNEHQVRFVKYFLLVLQKFSFLLR